MSLYICDPSKHMTCHRGHDICQRCCKLTTIQEFSTDGRELTEEEVERIEDQIRAKNEPGLKLRKARKA